MIVIDWTHLVGVVTLIGLVYVIFDYKQRRREKLHRKINSISSNNSNGHSKCLPKEDIVVMKNDISNIKNDAEKLELKTDGYIEKFQTTLNKIEVHMGTQVVINKNTNDSLKEIFTRLNKDK